MATKRTAVECGSPPPYESRLAWLGEPPPPPKPSSRPRRIDLVDRWLQSVERGEKSARTFASHTIYWGERGLALFNRMPSTAWWVRAYDLIKVLAAFELRALDGIVACGAGAPAETVPVARHVDSPRVAPMMAEAYARLAKQRALAETWLMSYPRAAAIGLVPNALGRRGKAQGYAVNALERLVSAGHGGLVRDIARAYGVEANLEDVLTFPSDDAGAPPSPEQATRRDERVRELEATVLRANASTAAYRMLDELAGIDTDRAVFAVAEIARRARSKPIRRRARDSLEAVRARRGLSESDLAERMIPTFGLDDEQASTVEVGGRRYRLRVSEAFAPELLDVDGNRTSRLPRGASAEVKRRVKLLAKELATVGKAMRSRLELRAIAGETWRAEVFSAHVIGHPVLREIARGLLFRTMSDGACFRVAEDYTFADVDDDAFELEDDAEVGIAHPLDVAAEELARWTELFTSYELLQPFEQLGRAHHHVEVRDGRAASLEGHEVSPGALLGLERRGYGRAHIDHGPTLMALDRELAGLHAIIDFRPGIRLADFAGTPPQTITCVAISGELTPRALSEIARDVLGLA